MRSTVETPSEYLEGLPNQQWKTITRVRGVILEHLRPGFVESIQYGMLAYCVPHSLYSKGYHVNPKLPLPYVSLAAQKNYYALYLMCLYPDSELCDWFTAEWHQTGKKLDMGKSCIRFKRVEDLALDVIAKLLQRVTVDDYVASYEAALAAPRTRPTKTKSTNATAKRNAKPKVATAKAQGAKAKRVSAKAAAQSSGAKPSAAATKNTNAKVAAKPKAVVTENTSTKVGITSKAAIAKRVKLAAKPKAVVTKSTSAKSKAAIAKGSKVATKPKAVASKTEASKRRNRRDA